MALGFLSAPDFTAFSAFAPFSEVRGDLLELLAERPADLSAQPLARCGQAFANEFGVCFEQALELTRVAGIDGGNRAVKEPVEISVGHFW